MTDAGEGWPDIGFRASPRCSFGAPGRIDWVGATGGPGGVTHAGDASTAS